MKCFFKAIHHTVASRSVHIKNLTDFSGLVCICGEYEQSESIHQWHDGICLPLVESKSTRQRGLQEGD